MGHPFPKTKLQLTWEQIPGWCDFQELYDEAVTRSPDGAIFVEVGVLFGKSAARMAQAIRTSRKKIHFDAVDLFGYDQRNLVEIITEYTSKCPNHDLTQVPMILDSTKTLSHLDLAQKLLDLTGASDLVRLVKSSGQLWASSYSAESLDFVFVDALHTYDDTKSLLLTYLPKIRRGGILAGHDYNYPTVAQAVREVLGDVDVRGLSFTWRKP
jgi:hypothetical protein